MGKPTGFMEYERQDPGKRPVAERVRDFREFQQLLPPDQINTQAARCMDCGIPFCHAHGCPVQNLIPNFNDMVYRGQWRHALDLLHATNNFPEITGRICPAPCEASCTLAISQPAVTIKEIELQIVERGWRSGWIKPEPAQTKTGKRVAIVGSGPAGLAAAQQLARMGHEAVVFERDDRIGGLLRYGIPDFKLDKSIIDRRMEQMAAEGVVFETDVNVGEDISVNYLGRAFDAVLLSGGARVPRDLPVPGRELDGVHFAMDFLTQQNRRVAGDTVPESETISATGKHVVVIGGGDTGADCVGTSHRQGARSVTQIEIMPKPPPTRDESTPWPAWPCMLRTGSSHEEGCERLWSMATEELTGTRGSVCGIRTVSVAWQTDPGTSRMSFEKVPGSEGKRPADLVLLSMGFTQEGNQAILAALGVETDGRGAARLDANCMSNVAGVFVAGDLSKGASLVVRAIADGRQAAEGITRYLAS